MSDLVQGVNSDGVVYTAPYVQHDTLATSLDCSKDGKTRQEFAAECDINTLLEHYENTGAWKSFNRMEPVYMDVTEVHDLPSAMQLLAHAEARFMTLPAKVRATFDNDPVRFVQYCEDPKNIEQLREWELAPRPAPEPAPIKVEVTNPAVDPPAV